MIVNDENIIGALQKTNMWGQTNHYMYCQTAPSLIKNILFGSFATLAEPMEFYAINQNENGIGIIPVNNEFLLDRAFFIPNDAIAKIAVSKEMFFMSFSLVSKNNEIFSFKASKKVFPVKQHADNVKEFVKFTKNYPNK